MAAANSNNLEQIRKSTYLYFNNPTNIYYVGCYIRRKKHKLKIDKLYRRLYGLGYGG